MVRIDILERRGNTAVIEFMGYISQSELNTLYNCLKPLADEGVTEVCIVANEVRNFLPPRKRDVLRLRQLGMKLRFQQLSYSIKRVFITFGLEDWIDD